MFASIVWILIMSFYITNMSNAQLYKELIDTIEPAIFSISSINSLAALSESTRLEHAGKSLTQLMEQLLIAHSNATLFSDSDLLTNYFDDAIIQLIDFFNENLMEPNVTKLVRLPDNTIFLRNSTIPQSTKITDLKNFPHLTDQLVLLVDKVNDAETMSELMELMDIASRFQTSLRKVGYTLSKIGSSLGLTIDFVPLETFSFQVG